MGDTDIKKDEILTELSECREDERSAQNQLIQVIATVGTILTFIFGASTFAEANKRVLFHLSNFILCTAFGYITSLGMSNVLRYHYMESLEDKLYKLTNEESGSEFIHWMSFSTSITTRNPLHLFSKYTKIHYIYYALATTCPILFCILITVFQYVLLKKYSIIDKIGIVLLSVFMVMSLVAFFYSSIRAKNMHEEAMKISVKKRRKRLDNKGIVVSKTAKKSILTIILYFIFPKIKDVQKTFLLILGFFTGLFFKNGNISITYVEFLNLIIALIVIEILVYQARYQWNDIRGMRGDIEDGKTDRLPIKVLGKKYAVIVSLCVMAIKIIMATLIIRMVSGKLSFQLVISVITIIICSICYETVRTIDNLFGIFLFVSLGYAIRFGLGVWIAYPYIFKNGIMLINNGVSSYIYIVLLLMAYLCLGEFSAILPWTHEIVCQIDKNSKLKKHKYFLYSIVKDRNKNVNVFKEKGKITDLWNLAYVTSIILLTIGNLTINFNIDVLIVELITLAFSVAICIGTFDKSKYILIVFIMFNVITNFLIKGELYVYTKYTQLGFTLIYFVLKFLFDPNFNFVLIIKRICEIIIGISKRLMKVAYILIISKDTYNYIHGDNKK